MFEYILKTNSYISDNSMKNVNEPTQQKQYNEEQLQLQDMVRIYIFR